MALVGQKLEPRNLVLIRNVRAHPELWKYDEERFHSLPRSEKHCLWDDIARKSGFQKTQDAKNKWRTLTCYLRQHITNVTKKVHRRYIPNTGDPNDKYVHLEDWRYYKYMQFVEHYNQKPPTRSNNNAVTSLDENRPMKVNNHSTTTPSALPISTPTLAATDVTSTCPMRMQIGNLIVEIEPTTSSVNPPLLKIAADSLAVPAFDNLSGNDQSLLAFFDAMLRSTQRLPKFHQERVKRKFINAIRKQK